ncbi:hypothetical protein NG798_24710 [Ancylothrix sp. C2]|uniref:hypothetical protein n=1 Tax=Ancylothrix sp. D3o TaxID=2953691 RepID=UPI0021BB96DC|nr:hypothetical protein [Ancylothrix sp. D3o]MCT7953004.1 hypothetical protein [Ancylothrix sp. D3o]
MLESNTKLPSEKKNLLKKCKDLIFTDHSELYGRNYVTEEVEEASKITVIAINVSSGIDGVSIFPLLLYSFKDMGPIGILPALLLALAQTKFTNAMGRAVATRKPGNRVWSTLATVSMLAMNIIMSLTSLVAPELSLNQTHLAELKAEELANEQEIKVNRVQPDLRAVNDAEGKCKEFQEKAAAYPEGSPARNDYFIKANGLYQEKNRDWRSVLVEDGQAKVPFCPLAKLLREDALKVSQAAKADWESKKAQIVQSASYIVGIKQVMPALYEQHFDSSGQLISGTEATRLAIQSTTTKLMTGNWNGLGFSLLFFATSVITSAGACTLAIAHSFREDIQMSFDESLQIKLDEFLEDN